MDLPVVFGIIFLHYRISSLTKRISRKISFFYELIIKNENQIHELPLGNYPLRITTQTKFWVLISPMQDKIKRVKFHLDSTKIDL